MESLPGVKRDNAPRVLVKTKRSPEGKERREMSREERNHTQEER